MLQATMFVLAPPVTLALFLTLILTWLIYSSWCLSSVSTCVSPTRRVLFTFAVFVNSFTTTITRLPLRYLSVNLRPSSPPHNQLRSRFSSSLQWSFSVSLFLSYLGALSSICISAESFLSPPSRSPTTLLFPSIHLQTICEFCISYRQYSFFYPV